MTQKGSARVQQSRYLHATSFVALHPLATLFSSYACVAWLYRSRWVMNIVTWSVLKCQQFETFPSIKSTVLRFDELVSDILKFAT